MNHIIADNRVSTIKAYLIGRLETIYENREAANLTQILFEEFSGWTRTEVILNAAQRVSESDLLRYHFALKRLMLGEPIQYVIGCGWFLDMKLHTSPAALIPRPETEELVHLIVDKNKIAKPRILDVGTGTGCIAIALKKQIEESLVTAIDISLEAIELAAKNAAAHRTPLDLFQMDILAQCPPGCFDVLVSNPPYIPQSESHSMADGVTHFEPHVALFTSDTDSLIFYRRLMELSPILMAPGGFAACEIHENSAMALLSMASNYSITNPTIHRDMQGKDRMMTWEINSPV